MPMPSRRGRIAGRLMLDCRARQISEHLLSSGHADDAFDTRALAAELGVSPQFLEAGRMPSRPLGLPFIRIGGLVIYRRSDVIKWLRERAELYEAAHAPSTSRETLHIIRGAR